MQMFTTRYDCQIKRQFTFYKPCLTAQCLQWQYKCIHLYLNNLGYEFYAQNYYAKKKTCQINDRINSRVL